MNRNFEFNIKDMNTYLQIDLKGKTTRNNICEFVKESIKISEQKKVYKFFINTQYATITATKQSQEFFVISDLKSLEYKRPYKYAVLIDTNDLTHLFFTNLLKLFHHNVKLFSEKNEALNWLLEN